MNLTRRFYSKCARLILQIFYLILGSPEAPHLDSVQTYIYNVYDQLSKVYALLKWTPGYNGGQRVWYNVYYGSRADQTLVTENIDNKCNCFTITQDLEASKDYIFYVQAHNSDGPSNSSNHIKRRTKGRFFVIE